MLKVGSVAGIASGSVAGIASGSVAGIASGSVAGFTLLEFLVVFLLLSVLFLFALPSFGVMIDRSRVNSGVEEFRGAFFLAEREAVRRKHRVVICASADGKVCDDGYANGVKMDLSGGYIVFDVEGGAVIRDYPPVSGVGMFVGKGRGVKVEFINNGRLVSNMNGANLTVESGKYSVQLNIAATGRIQNKKRK